MQSQEHRDKLAAALASPAVRTPLSGGPAGPSSLAVPVPASVAPSENQTSESQTTQAETSAAAAPRFASPACAVIPIADLLAPSLNEAASPQPEGPTAMDQDDFDAEPLGMYD